MDILHDPIFQHKWQMNDTQITKVMQEMTDSVTGHAPAPVSGTTTSSKGRRNRPSLVLTNSVDENWGLFSTKIHTRTGKWLNMTNHIKIHGSSYETIQAFLSHPSILLVAVNTHVDPNILTSLDPGNPPQRHNHNWLHSNYSADYIAASQKDSANFLPQIADKIICLPLGVKHKREIYNALKHFVGTRYLERGRLL